MDGRHSSQRWHVNLRQGHLILFVVAYKFVLFLDKKEERRVFIWGICFSLHLIE